MALENKLKDEKKQLRNKYRLMRDNLSKEELILKSKAIMESLCLTEEYKACQTIFTYINTNSEIITTELIKRAWRDKKTVAVPVMTDKAHEMLFIKITDFSELRKNKYLILEPEIKENNILKADEKTLNIVPCLVFDREKYRIGYGGGYYDKFIEENKTLSNIALAMDFQLVDKVIRESFDKPLDKIITETKIY